jgi:hypothetical protein
MIYEKRIKGCSGGLSKPIDNQTRQSIHLAGVSYDQPANWLTVDGSGSPSGSFNKRFDRLLRNRFLTEFPNGSAALEELHQCIWMHFHGVINEWRVFVRDHLVADGVIWTDRDAMPAGNTACIGAFPKVRESFFIQGKKVKRAYCSAAAVFTAIFMADGYKTHS